MIPQDSNEHQRSTGRDALPEDDPAWEGVVDQLQAWAIVEVDAAPTNLDKLHAILDQETAPRIARHGGRRLLYASALLASAALFLFAVSLIQLQIQVGSTVVVIGAAGYNINDSSESPKITELERRFNSNQQQINAAISELSQKATALEASLHDTALALSERQQAESLTRYRDVETLIALTRGQ